MRTTSTKGTNPYFAEMVPASGFASDCSRPSRFVISISFANNTSDNVKSSPLLPLFFHSPHPSHRSPPRPCTSFVANKIAKRYRFRNGCSCRAPPPSCNQARGRQSCCDKLCKPIAICVLSSRQTNNSRSANRSSMTFDA